MVTNTNSLNNSTQKSLGRLIRQLIFVPFLHNRWLTSDFQTTLSEHIANAEKGHRGEIRLIIENCLPISQAYHINCRERALQLFGEYGIWDTANNTGVLIYVNLCEHSLEIIADRGINAHAHNDWHTLCQETLTAFKQAKMADGLKTLIDEVGRLLNLHFPCDDIDGDELPNRIIYIK